MMLNYWIVDMLNCRNDQGKWLNMTLFYAIFLHSMVKKTSQQGKKEKCRRY